MGTEWVNTTIGNLIESEGGGIQTGPFGTKLKASEYSEDGVPVISVGEVQLGRFVLHARTPKVNSEITDRMPEYLLEVGDIVFGRKGSVERSALVSEKQVGWFLGSDGIRLRLPKTVNDKFIAYQLLSRVHKQWMVQHAAGTTMASLNEGIIRRIPIRVTSLEEQNAIAHVLGTLDEKIELNRQTNQTFEAMAQVLFKSWFVDFDPVIDNAQAAGNEIPEPLKARAAARQVLGDARKPLPEEIRHEFPDGFEFADEMGWVPRGWGVCKFKDAMELLYGKSLPARDRLEGSFPVYGSGGIASYHAEALVDGPGIVVGRKGTVGSVYWVDEDFYPIDTVFYVKPLGIFSLPYLLRVLLGIDIKSMGADSAVPGVNRNALYASPIVRAPESLLQQFQFNDDAMRGKRRNLEGEVQSLESIRDTLLPKLLSGQLTIPDAEKLVADAL